MTPKEFTIEPFTAGDLWEGVPGLMIKVGPEGGPMAAPESPLNLVTMRFKRAGRESTAAVEISSADADQIVIVNADEWEFYIPQQIVAGVTDGNWDWQICCTDTAGNPYTFLGDTVTIGPKI